MATGPRTYAGPLKSQRTRPDLVFFTFQAPLAAAAASYPADALLAAGPHFGFEGFFVQTGGFTRQAINHAN